MNPFAPFINFIESWLETAGALFGLLLEWAIFIGRADVLPSAWQLVSVPAFLALYLSSAFIAATIAEEKGRGRIIHFLPGLLLPGIYPLLMVPLSNLRRDSLQARRDADSSRRREISQDITGRFREKSGYTVPEQVEEPENPEKETQPPPDGSGDVLDRKYFSAVAASADGSPAGPFVIGMTDGREVEASRIVEAMADVLVVETVGHGGGTRTVRLMYGKIASCRLKQ